MSAPKDLPAVAPKTRMTVTKVGHKIDELHETVDTLHQEIEEIKIVLKNLVKLQLDVEENKTEDNKDFLDPAGANKEKIKTDAVDMDRRSPTYFLDTLDCQLITDDADFMGSDGEVIGDPFWKSEISGTSVSNYRVSEIDMISYPNPFTDQATIQFTLDKSTNVSIDIYDITGKTVRSINAGSFAAGENSVVIQREDLNSGIYLLKLNAGTNSGIMRISLK